MSERIPLCFDGNGKVVYTGDRVWYSSSWGALLQGVVIGYQITADQPWNYSHSTYYITLENSNDKIMLEGNLGSKTNRLMLTKEHND